MVPTLSEKKKMAFTTVIWTTEGSYKICIPKELWENRYGSLIFNRGWFCPWRYLAVSGDIWLSRLWEWVKARNAAKYSLVHREGPQHEKLPSPKCQQCQNWETQEVPVQPQDSKKSHVIIIISRWHDHSISNVNKFFHATRLFQNIISLLLIHC